MTSYDDLIEEVNSYNRELENLEIPPHSSNLLHQLRRKDKKKLSFFNELCKRYFDFRKTAQEKRFSLEEYVFKTVQSTNEYMDLFLTENPFSHQADFTSSIVPEMFFLIMYRLVKSQGLDLMVSAQSEVPIECMFEFRNECKLMYKTKRLDLVVCKRTTITIDESSYEFIIPLISMEMKTNLDKNMMSGIENSVTALKKTFPHCLYFVVTELSDMATDKLNYASSDIDEIYIVRKQKRASVRKNKREKKDIDASLIYEIVSRCLHQLALLNDKIAPIEERMQTGKLIH